MSRFRHLCFVALCTGLSACGQQDDATDTPMAALDSVKLGVDGVRYATWHPRSHAELCFAVDGGKDRAGQAVVLEGCNGGKEQAWARFGNELRIFADKCMVVVGGDKAEDGAKLEIAVCQDGAAQNDFDLTSPETIKWQHDSKLCVDVTDGEYEPGTQLQLWTCDEDNDNQSFGWMNTTVKEGATPAAGKPNLPATGAVSAPKAGSTTPVATPAPKAGTTAPVATTPPASNNDGKTAKATGNASNAAPAAAKSTVFAPSPAGTLVAPYYWNWSNKMSLASAYDKVGLRAATIAFGLSGGGQNACGVSGFRELAGDIKAFQGKGGQIVLSFGGAAGDYLNEKCADVSAIAKAILEQTKLYNTKLLDFDVEGSHIAKASVNQRLIDALAIVQKQDPAIYVSFTLAVDFESGLAKEAQSLLQLAVAKPLKVSRVNIMAMDYGRAPGNGKDAGDAAIMASEKTAAQMAKLWPKASKQEIYHAIGITPMIGHNDDYNKGNPAFTPADAKKVVDYAKKNGIGHLAWWSFERDNATKGDLDNHSNSQSSDYQFLKQFSEARK